MPTVAAEVVRAANIQTVFNRLTTDWGASFEQAFEGHVDSQDADFRREQGEQLLLQLAASPEMEVQSCSIDITSVFLSTRAYQI